MSAGGHPLGGLEGRKVHAATRYLGGIYCLTFDDGSTVTFSHATFTAPTLIPIVRQEGGLSCPCKQADCPVCSPDTWRTVPR